MDTERRAALTHLWSDDKQQQNETFYALIALTDAPVDWAYEVWDEMLASLNHPDNHRRAIAAQVLCNLAKSDPQGRMLKDFEALYAVTRDDRFVTARHCMQALWKVGIAGKAQQKLVVDAHSARFKTCMTEKNGTLIRYDIIQSLKNIYDAVNDEAIKAVAMALIDAEDDLRYRKKYAGVWKNK